MKWLKGGNIVGKEVDFLGDCKWDGYNKFEGYEYPGLNSGGDAAALTGPVGRAFLREALRRARHSQNIKISFHRFS
jgi:hypothetical protein